MPEQIKVSDHMTAHITDQIGDDFTKKRINLQINIKLPARLFSHADNLHDILGPVFDAAERAGSEAWDRITAGHKA